MIALQVAFSYFFFTFQNTKTSERIANEGQEWESRSRPRRSSARSTPSRKRATQALEAVLAENPVLAQYASMIAARDVVAYRLLEPWRRTRRVSTR
jgi:hypothetical protein